MRGCEWILGAAAAMALTACMDPAPYEPDDVDVNASAVLSLLPQVHDSPVWVRMNDAPYVTGLGTGAKVNVYVSIRGYEAYARIRPEADGSGADVPPGTMIVREVLAEDGSVDTFTLMYKGPPGYNPDLGDFWFGVTDASGVPKVKDGAERVGRVEDCYACHVDRGQDGFLFGVPLAVRSAELP
jgi:hypothetical protein